MEEQNNRENMLDKQEVLIFCPWCGKQISSCSLYCEFCGGYVPDEEVISKEVIFEEAICDEETALTGNTPPLQKLKSMFPNKRNNILLGLAAILAIFVIIITTAGGGTSTKEALFYIKDNSIYGCEADGASTEYTLSYLEKWGSRSGGGILSHEKKPDENSGNMAPAYSAAGQYLFYMDQGGKGSFDLSRTHLKKKETKTLDSGVVKFLPVGDGQVVYQKENQALYYYDGSRKRRLAQRADYYRVSEAGDGLIWTTEEEGARDIYYQKLSEESEKQRLERNVKLLDVSPDLNTVLVQKEDTVYHISNQQNRKALAAEVSRTVHADAAAGTFYFVRDVDRTPSTSYKELYYYSAGKAVLLDDSLKNILWNNDGIVLYIRTDDEQNVIMAADGKVTELRREVAFPEQAVKDGEQLYFLSPDEAVGKNGNAVYELCYVSLSGGSRGRVDSVDRGVSEIACIFGGQAYYFKDLSNGVGDLYGEGELLAYDVALGSVAGIPDSGRILCIADCSNAKRRGTLTMLGLGEDRNLADDVFGYSAVSENEIMILAEYNHEKERGNLLRYDGKNIEIIDRDVWGYYAVGLSGICR